ncbi:MAG: type IX secretion system protein PorQ [Bacteroidota bacterium]
MKKPLLYIFITSFTSLFAQIGGTKVFRFLDLQVPARSSALGGATNAIWDNDVNLSYNNPALLNKLMSKQLAFNYVNYVADLNYGNFMYAHQIKNHFTLGAGIQYFNYGKIDGRDEFDKKTGTIKASDYALNLSIAKPLNEDSSLSIGATLKTIYSYYDSYYSFGNAVDIGLTYHSKKNLTITILAKNYGTQWRTYTGNGEKEKLPSNFQIGISKKISKAPFRLILLYDQLFKWDLTYADPNAISKDIDQFTKKPIVKSKSQIRNEKIKNGFDKFIRHFVIGTEIVFTKNFNIRIAYNFKTSKEMSLPDKRSLNGLSVGFGLKINKFHLSYGYFKQAVAGNSHTIGITTNFNYFNKK